MPWDERYLDAEPDEEPDDEGWGEVDIDRFYEDLGKWEAEEKAPYFEELGRIIAASARLEGLLRQIVLQLLDEHEHAWAVINQLSASQLANTIDAIAKDGNFPALADVPQLKERLLALVKEARPALGERNVFAHGSWQHEPWQTALVLAVRRSKREAESREVTRDGLLATADHIEAIARRAEVLQAVLESRRYPPVVRSPLH